MRHPSAEFSGETKRKALERARYRCEICGKKARLEIHHILPLYVASQVYKDLPHAALRSLQNAACVCPDCHNGLHERGWHERDYSTIASVLYGMFELAKPSKTQPVSSPDAPKSVKKRHSFHPSE